VVVVGVTPLEGTKGEFTLDIKLLDCSMAVEWSDDDDSGSRDIIGAGEAIWLGK